MFTHFLNVLYVNGLKISNLKAIEQHWQKPINPFPAEKIEDLQGLLEAIDKKQKLMEAEMKIQGITSLDDE